MFRFSSATRRRTFELVTEVNQRHDVHSPAISASLGLPGNTHSNFSGGLSSLGINSGGPRPDWSPSNAAALSFCLLPVLVSRSIFSLLSALFFLCVCVFFFLFAFESRLPRFRQGVFCFPPQKKRMIEREGLQHATRRPGRNCLVWLCRCGIG